MSCRTCGLVRGYDYEDTPRYEAQNQLEKQYLNEEIERRCKNDPSN